MSELVFSALSSLFYEEMKGDFTLAQTLGEASLEETAVGSPPGGGAVASAADRGEALVTLAYVSIMAGRLPRAFQLLDEARQLAAGNHRLQLLEVTCRLLAIHEHYNTFPDGNGAGAFEISVRWRGAEDLREEDALWNRLMQATGDEALRNTSWLIYGFLCSLKPARSTLGSNRYVAASFTLDQSLPLFTAAPRKLLQWAEAASQWGVAGYAAWVMADLYRRAGLSSEAATFLDQAESLYLHAEDTAGTAFCLMTRADWLAAPYSSPLVWNLAIEESTSDTTALPVSMEAEEFRLPGPREIETATSLYAEARHFFATAGAARGAAVLLLRQGYLSLLRDDFGGTAASAGKAAALFRQCGDLRGAFLAATHQALALATLGRKREALILAHDTGTLSAHEGSFSYALGLAFMAARFGRHLLLRRGEYEKSLAAFEIARILFETCGAPSNHAQILVDLGAVHQAAGEREAALTWYEEALELIAADARQRLPLAPYLLQRQFMLNASVFRLCLQQTDPDGMERCARRFRQLTSQLPPAIIRTTEDATTSFLPPVKIPNDTPSSAGAPAMAPTKDHPPAVAPDQLPDTTVAGSDSLPDSTMTTASPINPGAADAYSEGAVLEALRGMAEYNMELSLVLVPLYRARNCREAGDESGASHWLAEARRALPKVNQAQRPYMKTLVLAEQRLFPEAADVYREHLRNLLPGEGFAGELSALIRASGGDHLKAEQLLEQRRHLEQAFTMFVRLKAYGEAYQYLEKLELLAGSAWWRDGEHPWQSLSEMGEMYEGLATTSGEKTGLTRALEVYELAIGLLEERRGELTRDELKTALASDKSAQYLYGYAARAATRLGDSPKAFLLAEKAKSRALLDLVAGDLQMRKIPAGESAILRAWREQTARLALLRGLLAQERKAASPARQRLDALSAQKAAAEETLLTLEGDLAATLPEFHALASGHAPLLSVEEVARLLPPETLLLEYYTLDEDLLMWAIDKEGVAAALAFKTSEILLDREIEAFVALCEGALPDGGQGTRLAEKLLLPLAGILDHYARLIIVPHGKGHLLPFEALPFRGEPLGARREISRLPAASLLAYLSPGQALLPPGKLLAVGNPDGSLAWAETEARYVASLFGGRALLGVDASEEKVRKALPGCALVHFATHGKLDRASPFNSSLLLAGGEELTVYELAGIRLDAELVVLSACETGKGRTTGGDDLLGLTRALLGAGAHKAIVSLWPVDDLSTSLMMGEFYRRLLTGLSPAAALRHAREYLRNLTPGQLPGEIERLKMATGILVPNEAIPLRHSNYSPSDQPHRLPAQITPPREEATASPDHLPSAIEREDTPPGEIPPETHSRPGRPFAPPRETRNFSHPHYWAPFILVG